VAYTDSLFEKHSRFASRFLSSRRDVIVWLPPGYEAGGRYPVLYLQDGQNLFDPATAFGGRDWQAHRTAECLIRSGAIEPLILVGVGHTGVRRISEYTPTRDPARRKGGKGDRYARMLARELKPFIDSSYRTLRGPAGTAVGGSSLGALVSLQAGLLYPRVFGKMALLSPSLWWHGRCILDLVRASRSSRRPRVWLDAGTAEGPDVLADLRLLRDALVEKQWDLRYCEAEGAGHNEAAWGARFGAVLKFLFPPNENAVSSPPAPPRRRFGQHAESSSRPR